MEKAKNIILEFFNTLSSYDYIGFFLAFFLFFLFLILALLLRKRIKISVTLVLFGFAFLFAGPPLIHKFVKHTIFKNDANMTEVKQLFYSDTLLIKGTLNYQGIKDAKHCKIEASIHKIGTNMLKDFVYSLKTYRYGFDTIDKAFSHGDQVNFKIVIEPFNYKGDYNITMNSGCYK